MTLPRVASALAVVAVAAAVAPSADAAAPRWSLRTVLFRIDGARVAVGHWSGRVDTSSTLCSGAGRGALWAGRRHWRDFTCTWTIVGRRGLVDRDVTFRVHVLSGRRCVVGAAQVGTWTTG